MWYLQKLFILTCIRHPWFLTNNIFLLNYQICRNSNTELNMLENESIVLLSDLQIYNPLLADVPTWFQTSVISFFSILMSIGIFLNGFVVGCFAFSPNVSNWSKSLALLQNDCNIHYGYDKISYTLAIIFTWISIDKNAFQSHLGQSGDSRISTLMCWGFNRCSCLVEWWMGFRKTCLLHNGIHFNDCRYDIFIAKSHRPLHVFKLIELKKSKIKI